MNVKLGGYYFQKRRKELDLTLEDIQRLTDGKISAVAASRIENGAFARPGYELVMEYGKVLGMTPTDIARHYGMWLPDEKEKQDYYDDKVSFIRATLRDMPDTERDEMLGNFIALMHAKLNRKSS